MSSTQYNIQELLKKYREGTASAEERALLEAWYHALEYDATAFADEEAMQQMQAASWEVITAGKRQQAPVVGLFRRYRIGVAAAVVLAVAGITWFTINRQQPKQETIPTAQTTPAAPASDKAVLTLADGRQIVLEQADSGAIAEQNGIRIIKLNNGQLAYDKANKSGAQKPSATAMYNTLTTPRGGQYKIVLPDGTVVQMNSASSITYPTAFAGKERVVKLNGEAYFEVARNAQQPFKVEVNKTVVDVLGTAFNIHAYTDEPAVTTTLVNGSVRVTHTMAAGSKSELLTPGQQAVGAETYLVTRKANMRQVLSWKNGLFIFEDRKLEDVLREVSRWYDIDIDMQAPADDTRYGGVINRNSDLKKVLELLERNGIRHFKIEGRKVIVLP
ncbi:FecR family protein [Filimonas lacunae]|uniref:FecR family protein n=1 Tax=Filimonas lacunae TaxID=477680 RepID=A0A173MHQ4_9BACT|nr:FecR domain-containing protein [Filimonas lacunae]BAV06951.1 anti-sigma factor [Filimonas lacunae]SIS97322.1 FecR family protein [Filimonas lacunae]